MQVCTLLTWSRILAIGQASPNFAAATIVTSAISTDAPTGPSFTVPLLTGGRAAGSFHFCASDISRIDRRLHFRAGLPAQAHRPAKANSEY